jgi:outer membrane protein OmpA-like peptidoglycan-associated protein
MDWMPFPQNLREGLRRSLVSNRNLALLFLMTLTAQSHAQDIYAFKDKDQLANAMLALAARTARNVEVPDPCRLHVVVIAGGRELFAGPTFDTMHHTMARGLLGEDGIAACGLELHELARDGADTLLSRLEGQGRHVLILETTYIPLSSNVVAYAKLRDGTKRLLGESGRYDLPVAPVNAFTTVETTASIEIAVPPPKPKLTDKLLTEVHFDSGSAAVTFVGKKKVQQAIEAIRKQNPREIRILGFSDSKGSAAANKAVSGARAANVARMLKEAGLDIPLIVEGRGEEGGPHKIPDGISEPLNRCVGIIAVGVPAGQ